MYDKFNMAALDIPYFLCLQQFIEFIDTLHASKYLHCSWLVSIHLLVYLHLHVADASSVDS